MSSDLTPNERAETEESSSPHGSMPQPSHAGLSSASEGMPRDLQSGKTAAPQSPRRAEVGTNNSVLTYGGVTRRTTAWVQQKSGGSKGMSILLWTGAVLFLMVMYGLLIYWYLYFFLRHRAFPESAATFQPLNTQIDTLLERQPPLLTGDQPLLTFNSHVKGLNAHVTVWPDRIEWEKRAGVFLRRETNVIPVRTIQSVSTGRSGVQSSVTIRTAGGEPVDMRVSRQEADSIQNLIMRLIASASSVPGGSGSAPFAPPPPPAAPPTTPTIGIAEELRHLVELRESGVLTEEEFEAQKARLLGN